MKVRIFSKSSISAHFSPYHFSLDFSISHISLCIRLYGFLSVFSYDLLFTLALEFHLLYMVFVCD